MLIFSKSKRQFTRQLRSFHQSLFWLLKKNCRKRHESILKVCFQFFKMKRLSEIENGSLNNSSRQARKKWLFFFSDICSMIIDYSLIHNLFLSKFTHMSLCMERFEQVQFGAVPFLASESVGVLTGSQTSTKMSSVILSVVPELAWFLPASELSCLLYCMLWTCP